jgi:hypothetical protein
MASSVFQENTAFIFRNLPEVTQSKKQYYFITETENVATGNQRL